MSHGKCPPVDLCLVCREAADRASKSDHDSHKDKRVKLDPMTQKPIQEKADKPDAVAKKMISDRDARNLVRLWFEDLSPFCAVLDPNYDTYEDIRRRSSFLFNTVLYTAARSFQGQKATHAELSALAEETRECARTAIFDPNPPLETIQAVLLMGALAWLDLRYAHLDLTFRSQLVGTRSHIFYLDVLCC